MYPGLVSCPFYAIPIYPFKFMNFFIYLSHFIFLLPLRGNVAVYKVLNLEMLLYKVRWHVSTVKECNLTARPLTLRSRTHSRNVIARVLAIDHACFAGASKTCLQTFIAVRKDEQETADLFYISRLWPGC